MTDTGAGTPLTADSIMERLSAGRSARDAVVDRRPASVADGPGPEERPDLEAVYAVVFSNYEPAETDSLWRDKAKADARADELNSGKTTGWDVVKWTLSDAALPVHREEPTDD